eukprot:scaffold263_cov251-Pinguiococcus_pyrenoidosus.AAC.13
MIRRTRLVHLATTKSACRALVRPTFMRLLSLRKPMLRPSAARTQLKITTACSRPYRSVRGRQLSSPRGLCLGSMGDKPERTWNPSTVLISTFLA